MLCNQQFEIKETTKDIVKKIDSIASTQQQMVRVDDDHKMRIQKVEENINLLSAAVRVLQDWQLQILTIFAASAIVLPLVIPYFVGWLNERSWRKRRKQGAA